MKNSIISSNNNRKKSCDLAGVQRTRLTIEYLLRTERIDTKTLQRTYSGEAEASNAIVNWLKGFHVMKYNSIIKLRKLYPNNDFYKIYELSLFDLLKNKPMTKKQLEKLVSPYIDTSNHLDFWDFSIYQNGDKNGKLTPLSSNIDTESLFQRGDLYGFMGILYHVRMAECTKDTDKHLLYMSEAYRALPGLCRYTHFKNRWKEFYHLLLDLHMRVKTTWFLLKPNIKLIKSQIFAKKHHTFRIYRSRHPITNKWIEPEPPFILSSFKSDNLTMKFMHQIIKAFEAP